MLICGRVYKLGIDLYLNKGVLSQSKQQQPCFTADDFTQYYANEGTTFPPGLAV